MMLVWNIGNFKMNKIYILIIAMLMILSCSDIREDVIIIQNNVNNLKIYRNDPYIYVQSKCDKIITVSDGIRKQYEEDLKVNDITVVASLPDYYDLSPTKIDDKIRIIHHGLANSSRKTSVMVEMMDYTDKRFTLDLMLANSKNDRYWHKINNMAKIRDNVRVISPVAMQKIVPYTNSYDIGLFLCPPTNFNLKYTLPNKFFEFIQARLAVAIGPGIEMAKIVSKYDCGIVAKDFEPRSLAKELNLLTFEKLAYYKQQSHKAADELNANTNQQKILRMVRDLLAS